MIKVADEKELLTAVESIPLFPLPGMVFIPYTVLPLHVFELRKEGVEAFRALQKARQIGKVVVSLRDRTAWPVSSNANSFVVSGGTGGLGGGGTNAPGVQYSGGGGGMGGTTGGDGIVVVRYEV